MSDLANKQVHPDRTLDYQTGGLLQEISGGMTLREHYAGLAMQGCLSSEPDGLDLHVMGNLASYAVRVADALIAELERASGQEAKD